MTVALSNIILMLMLLLLLLQVIALKMEDSTTMAPACLAIFKCNYFNLRLKVFLSEAREVLLKWGEKCQCATAFVILLDTKSSYIESQRY